jgi:excisionase family DNA binding protein
MRYLNGAKHLTPAEAARVLGVTRPYVLNAIREQKLRAHWHRYRLYVPELEVERYLEEHLNRSVNRVAAKILHGMGIKAHAIFTWTNGTNGTNDHAGK